MKKIRQIAAIILIAILIILYIATIVTGLFATRASHNLFLFSVAMTFFVPVVMYVLNMFAKLFKNCDKKSIETDSDAKSTTDSNNA